MNRADELFYAGMHEIKNCGDNDYDEVVRPKYKDGAPAHAIFITQHMEKYDIDGGDFPITTLRPIHFQKAIGEILWIYRDQSNDLDLLKDKYGIGWWDDWVVANRNIGQRYGATVRRYNLMNELLDGLTKEAYGRRHIIDLYQYTDLKETPGLYPCAFQTMWSVRNGGYLDMTLTQRSSDYLVAGHINKMQYVAFMMMVAKHCGLKPGRFAHFVQNLHIYDRHLVQLDDLMNRYNYEMGNGRYSSSKPRLILDTDKTNFYDFEVSDFKLVDYKPLEPQLKFELGI